MAYLKGSGWSDKTELECYLIFRKCEAEGFPHGMVADLCRALARRYEKPSVGSLNSKVGNYKSFAGITGPSGASIGMQSTFHIYKNTSIKDIQATLDRMP